MKKVGSRSGACVVALLSTLVAGGCAVKEPQEPTGSGQVATRGRGGAKTIIGTDDRVELYEGGRRDGDPQWMHIGRSVPALVQKQRLTQSGGRWQFETADPYALMCPDQPFAQQRYGAECTAALVGDDLILTAHHCIRDIDANGNYFDLIPFRSVLFGFTVDVPDQSNQGRSNFANDEVYQPVEIVARGPDFSDDWAVVRLDRKVHPRYKRLRIGTHPLRYAVSSPPGGATPLYAIGYGMGYPTKLSSDGYADWDQGIFIRAVLDILPGNSGSPVLDRETHTIVGVVTQAADAATRLNPARNCQEYVSHAGDAGVTMIAVKLNAASAHVPTPAGSCAGACGGIGVDQGCYCDDNCAAFGDCCADKTTICAPGERACDNLCAGQAPEGCHCDADCAYYGDCCPGYFDSCGTARP